MAEVQIPLHQKTMSNRYPSKNILEIRGYSGTSKKSIKFMEKPTKSNYKVYPQSLIKINPNNDSITMDTLVDLLDDIPNNDNDNYNVLQRRHHRNNSWNEESNEGWTSTGVLSDRSSVYSIDDADFDREASKKVNNQLKEIETILFEQNLSYRPILSECKEWIEKFPHLRVLGNQIANIPKEEGFSHNESKFSIPILQKQQSINNNNNNNNENSIRNVKRRENSDLTSNQGLLINGLNIPLKTIEITDKNSEYKFLEEEIFEEEGNYEELFAYDNREDEYLLEHNKRLNINKRRRRNLPPVTPKAAMKDIVLNLLFDHIWSEIINWSSDTIKKYAKLISSGSKEYSIEHSTPLINDSHNNETINDNTKELTNNVIITNNHNHTNNTNTNNNNQILINNNTKQYNIKNNINNSNNNNLILKNNSQNIIQFNTNNNNNNNNNNNQEIKQFPRKTNIQFNSFNNENNDTIQPLPPSRDSTFYVQQVKAIRNHSSLTNENLTINSYDRSTLNGSTLDTIDPLDNFLKIKQLKSGSSTYNRPIPTTSNSRLGSGNRKQYPLSNKRYQQRYQQNNDNKIPLDTIHDNRSIVVHGAAVVKPVNNNNNNNHDHSNINNRNNHANNHELTRNVYTAYTEENKSAVNDLDDDDDDYYDASVSVGIPHHSNYGVENDNFDENISLNNGVIAYGRYDNVHNSKKLPPIESLLTTKNLRISSANNSKQYREKNDRPMTTTATRNEPNGIKRVTTPSMQVNNNGLNTNRSGGMVGLVTNNIQITGIRYSNDETSSIISSMSINPITNNIPLNNNYSKMNPYSNQSSRKNSIRDSYANSRFHNKYN